jgi:hypothetical protein
MLRNTDKMQMLECQDSNTHACPAPATSPLMSSTFPILLPNHLTWFPSSSNLPFPPTGCLKSPACKKGVLSPLTECYSDGQGSLSSLLALIKTCCLWSLQILSQYMSLISFFIFLSSGTKILEIISSGGMPFLGYLDSVVILIWPMVHPHGFSSPDLIRMH